jgi:hypothetical protein
MNTIKTKKMLEVFFSLKNWLGFVRFITKYGVISPKESEQTNKKKKEKFSRSQENEVRRMIFVVKMLLLRKEQ